MTTSGAFCVPWNGPSGKQPFERLIIARRLPDKEHISIPDQKLVVQNHRVIVQENILIMELLCVGSALQRWQGARSVNEIDE